jgi:hypothetical protein
MVLGENVSEQVSTRQWKDVTFGGPGAGSSDNVGHIPVWGVVRHLEEISIL